MSTQANEYQRLSPEDKAKIDQDSAKNRRIIELLSPGPQNGHTEFGLQIRKNLKLVVDSKLRANSYVSSATRNLICILNIHFGKGRNGKHRWTELLTEERYKSRVLTYTNYVEIFLMDKNAKRKLNF